MKSVGSSQEDGIAVLLVLRTEENMQEFFRWYRSLKKDPTPQQCFEKVVEIWMTWGPDPEEEKD